MTQTQRAGILGTIVLAILLAAFTGSALAGNGNGNGAGNGNGNGNSQAAPATQPASPAPGNSANAPGHNKDSTTSSPTATQTPTGGGSTAATSGGHGKGHSKASGTTSSGKGSASQNSPSIAGVKPTNATFHNTHTTVGASPNVSKRYGNGQTAAGIASSRGAPGNTRLYGPGNSQPHKVETCPGSGHWVDVHAVKSYSTTSCASSAQESTQVQHVCGETTVTSTTTQHGHAYGRIKHGKALHTQTKTESFATGESCSSVLQNVLPLGGSTSNTTSATNIANTSQTSQVAASQVASSQAATQATGSSANSAGGVLGASATVKHSGKPAGGVAGAIAAVGNVAGQTLPFTGFPVWVAVAIALVLTATGLALRRRGRATI